MATRQSTIDLLLEQARAGGRLTAKTMFGEFALYCDGKLVAMVCDDQLFVKATADGRAYLGTVIEAAPYPKAKPCFLISGDAWDDAEWLAGLIRISAAALPQPVARTRKALSATTKRPKT